MAIVVSYRQQTSAPRRSVPKDPEEELLALGDVPRQTTAGQRAS
jgi:hypothetical protein